MSSESKPAATGLNNLQLLLHDALIRTQHVERCAVIRRRDASLRAASLGYVPDPSDMQMLVDVFKTCCEIRERGLVFEGKHYECVRADKNSIYAKFEGGGLVVVKTPLLLVLSTYSSTMYPSICVEATEKLGEYFKSKAK